MLPVRCFRVPSDEGVRQNHINQPSNDQEHICVLKEMKQFIYFNSAHLGQQSCL